MRWPIACIRCVFPETHPAVDEERVVSLAGRLRHRQAGGVGELVVRADDERFEVFRGFSPWANGCGEKSVVLLLFHFRPGRFSRPTGALGGADCCPRR